MAEVRIDGNQLSLVLTNAEKLEGIHGNLRVPLSSVQKVEVLEDAMAAGGVRTGVKFGTRIPGVITVGQVRTLRTKRFVVLHHNTPRGIRISLGAGPFDEWIVGCADPEGLAAAIPTAG